MKKLIGTLLLLCAVFMFAACNNAQTVDTPTVDTPAVDPDAVDPPMEVLVYHEPLTPAEAREYQVGFATIGMERAEDEYRGVEDMIDKYGSADSGGLIKHIVFPSNFADEQETISNMIASLADDPKVKAVIVNQGISGIAAGFQKIREAGRDDIILMASWPQDDPEVISKVADVLIGTDDIRRSYYDIVLAKKVGATHFVYMSFPRHMEIDSIARSRAIYEQACKDMGIEFVFVTVPDPATEIGVAGAQPAVYNMMPGLVDKYGKDAVYFTTTTVLHDPIIQQCLALGAMFLNQNDITPLCGYPAALGIDLSAEIGDYDAVVKKIEADVVARGGSGRMGTYPISFSYAASVVLGELAIDMIEGRASGDVQKDLIKVFESIMPGSDWTVGLFTSPDGSTLDNYYLLTMDSYIFGKGYSGVINEPFPEDYYNIK